MAEKSSAQPRTIYQVSDLAEMLRGLLEESFPRLWVQGEVSNLARPASGHWYFTLKDASAQLRCVMFKGNNFHVRPQPRDGDSVLVRGTIGLYAARGDLQFICEHMEPAGEGALLRAFEQLKSRLLAEGLFDEAKKRPIPKVPRQIGVITSGSGAALQDILTTLSRRYPLGRVVLYPVPVQGSEAAPAIAKALRELPQRAPVDVILLARGGGSLEDLWAFNEEMVARAIRACEVPVVTGVGHETDTTIADFAADLRAPTPTGAAELVSPDVAEWSERLEDLSAGLEQAMADRLEGLREQVLRHAGRLQLLHPGRRLGESAQRLDELSERLALAHEHLLRRCNTQQATLAARLAAAAPANAIRLGRQQLQSMELHLQASLRSRLQDARSRLSQATGLLQSYNPRAVLERGYAIALAADGSVLTDAAAANAGDKVRVQLARGVLDTSVDSAHEAPK